jgi:hypothetical protein
MNVPADTTNVSDFPDFAQSLLNLAERLDSQDEYVIDLARRSGVQIRDNVLTNPHWKEHMGWSQFTPGRYYHPKTTTKERVLAVLMLREMGINGDI